MYNSGKNARTTGAGTEARPLQANAMRSSRDPSGERGVDTASPLPFAS